MDTTTLRIFVEIAAQGSFAEAARKRQMSTSKVSNLILKLEQELDVRLFYRTTRTVRLTETGEALRLKAEHILALERDMQSIAEQSKQQASGRLRISAPLALSRQYLGRWLIEFKQRYPEVTIELVSSNHNLDFHQHELDFAIRQGPQADSSQYARKLADIDFGLFASADFLRRYGRPKTLNELNERPCICNGSEGKVRGYFLQHKSQEIRFRPRQHTLLDDAELILEAVEAGLGIGFLPLNMVNTARLVENTTRQEKKSLMPVLEAYWPNASEMFLVYPDKQRLSARHQLFIDFMLEKRSLLNTGKQQSQ
jgi:LysR family transcriptional regulator for bpeEF and oprC